jgi:hypothetical protein
MLVVLRSTDLLLIEQFISDSPELTNFSTSLGRTGANIRTLTYMVVNVRRAPYRWFDIAKALLGEGTALRFVGYGARP